MRRLSAKIDYEALRKARILENQARLASLGLQKSVDDLRANISSAKSVKRRYNKRVCSTPLRRSDRLKGISSDLKLDVNSLRRSDRLKLKPGDSVSPPIETTFKRSFDNGEKKRPANAPLVRFNPDVLARHCNSKSSGSVHDAVFGICCHFCRQKKLCGEEDCKRCRNFDTDQPCLGKTDCSVCHSSHGVLCRACLRVRYGEEMDEIRKNKKWMCPHCIVAKGINPYWICNSSLCLRKRNMIPTGIAIFKAREMGYKSVAHLLMDKLQGAAKHRRFGLY